jgi:hypothetical protein
VAPEAALVHARQIIKTMQELGWDDVTKRTLGDDLKYGRRSKTMPCHVRSTPCPRLSSDSPKLIPTIPARCVQTRSMSGNFTLRARIAAYSKWAKTADATSAPAPARSAFLPRFEREVDPDGNLPAAERTRGAEAARKAYFARLAYKAKSRRRK